MHLNARPCELRFFYSIKNNWPECDFASIFVQIDSRVEIAAETHARTMINRTVLKKKNNKYLVAFISQKVIHNQLIHHFSMSPSIRVIIGIESLKADSKQCWPDHFRILRIKIIRTKMVVQLEQHPIQMQGYVSGWFGKQAFSCDKDLLLRIIIRRQCTPSCARTHVSVNSEERMQYHVWIR